MVNKDSMDKASAMTKALVNEARHICNTTPGWGQIQRDAHFPLIFRSLCNNYHDALWDEREEDVETTC